MLTSTESEGLVRLESTINELSKKIDNIGIHVEWEVKTTDTGIVLVGGPTTVKKSGLLVGTMLMPIGKPGEMTVGFVIKTSEGTTELVPAFACKYI